VVKWSTDSPRPEIPALPRDEIRFFPTPKKKKKKKLMLRKGPKQGHDRNEKDPSVKQNSTTMVAGISSRPACWICFYSAYNNTSK
jgi:hypothetical protein